MNILIVGNGFDLSHYLPTKYDHFMDVMAAIEDSKSESMSFDELFSTCREDWFIAKTKEYYLTENILLEKEQLNEIKDLLKDNSWYKFFKEHVVDIKTWIDFELKIQEAIWIASESCNDILKIRDMDEIYKYFDMRNKESSISLKNGRILNIFKFTENEEYRQRSFVQPLQGGQIRFDHKTRINVNKEFCYGKEIRNGFNPSDFLNFMYKDLEKIIELFNLYLDLIVAQLGPASMFEITSMSWVEPDKIFSFNYTNTFQRIYDSIEVDYLHGSHGEFQNIVLGISDIEDESLRKLKAYGFTKYHQKLFKDTDYLFLDEYKKRMVENIKLLDAYDSRNIDTPVVKMGQRIAYERKGLLNLNFQIWGHSLDISDQDYIIDLFSLNDDMDRNVRVTVFYFDKSAKFSLLNNLLAILKKDKVEQWMKNGWLKFEENPKINFGIQEEIEHEKEAS